MKKEKIRRFFLLQFHYITMAVLLVLVPVLAIVIVLYTPSSN